MQTLKGVYTAPNSLIPDKLSTRKYMNLLLAEAICDRPQERNSKTTSSKPEP